MNTYTVSQFAEMTGYAVKTLQRWDREKRLVPLRTPTNRRMYSDEHLRLLRGMPHKDEHRDTIVYMRVSSQAQRHDDHGLFLCPTGWLTQLSQGFEESDLR